MTAQPWIHPSPSFNTTEKWPCSCDSYKYVHCLSPRIHHSMAECCLDSLCHSSQQGWHIWASLNPLLLVHCQCADCPRSICIFGDRFCLVRSFKPFASPSRHPPGNTDARHAVCWWWGGPACAYISFRYAGPVNQHPSPLCFILLVYGLVVVTQKPKAMYLKVNSFQRDLLPWMFVISCIMKTNIWAVKGFQGCAACLPMPSIQCLINGYLMPSWFVNTAMNVK